MTPAEVVAKIEEIHDAENWNLGTGSTRGYRNAFFARAIGIVHHGHPIYNATPDSTWLLKKTSSGAPQSDDTTAHTTDSHYWDMIVGSGANGYSFSASDLGVVSQFEYAPPVPNPGVVDGGSFSSGDFKYKVGHFQKQTGAGIQTIPSIVDECGDIGTKGVFFWGTTSIPTTGIDTDLQYFMGFGTVEEIINGNGSKQFGYGLDLRSGAFTFMWQSCANNAILFTNIGFVQQSVIGGVNLNAPASFDVNYSVNNGAVCDVNYLALGGEDLKVKVVRILNPSALGEIDYAVPDMGQITGVILVGSHSGNGNSQFNPNLPCMGFGMQDGDGPHQYCLSNFWTWAETFNTLKTYSNQRTSKIFSRFKGGVSDIGTDIRLVSLGIDTFRLDWDAYEYAGGPQPVIYAIVISGPQMYAGSLLAETALGPVDTVLPFDPGVTMILSNGFVAADTTTKVPGARWSIGAMDGLRQFNYWMGGNNNGVPPSVKVSELNFRDKIFTKADAHAVGIQLRSEASGALKHNAFELDWLTVDGIASQLLHLSFQAGVFFEDECDGSEAVTIACPLEDEVLIDTVYSDFLVATGGVEPYVFAIATGSLPTGLSLNTATGEISGTVTVVGVFTFQATVTDADDRVASIECTIEVTEEGCPLSSSNNTPILSSNLTQLRAATSCPIEVEPFSGIYKLVPNKVNDTVFGPSGNPLDIINIAIPNPNFETAFVGNR